MSALQLSCALAPGLLALALEAAARRRCRSCARRCAARLATHPPQPPRRSLLAPLTLLAAGAVPGPLLLALGTPQAAALLLALMPAALYYVVDGLKFAVLREPLVWSDLCLVGEIIMCPRLYFAYIAWWWWALLAAAAAAAAAAVAASAAAATPLEPGARLVALAAAAGAAAAAAAALAAGMRRHPLSCDALRDGAERGPLYAFCLQWLQLWRDEAGLRRGGLEAWLAARAAAQADGMRAAEAVPAGCGRSVCELRFTCPPQAVGHVVVVQAESFCDLRRFGLATGPTPGMLCDPLLQPLGQLAIGYLGAYTMRTEFSVLTGRRPQELGAYAYNPYLLLRRHACDSVARRARAAGFTTVCVHPNHGAFFARRRVMAQLGFEHFLDLAALPQLARDGCHVSDEALLGLVAERLRLHRGRRLFVFVITMQAHGPWRRGDHRALFADPPPQPQPQLSRREQEALIIYAHHLQALDRGVRQLSASLRSCDALVVYGDHLPAMAALERSGGSPPPPLLPEVLACHVQAAGTAASGPGGGGVCYNQMLDLSAIFTLVCSLR